jgi:predicted dehydrogenase
VTVPRLDTGEALLAEAAHFIDCIKTGGIPITDGVMGLQVLEVLEGATKSMNQRGQPVEFRPLRMAS